MIQRRLSFILLLPEDSRFVPPLCAMGMRLGHGQTGRLARGRKQRKPLMLTFTFCGLDQLGSAQDGIQVYAQLNPKAGHSAEPGLRNRKLCPAMDIPGA